MLIRCSKCGKIGLLGSKTCPHCAADITDELKRAKALGGRVLTFVVAPVLIAIVALTYFIRSEGSVYDEDFPMPDEPQPIQRVTKPGVDEILQQVSDPAGADARLDRLNRELGGGDFTSP